MYRHWFPVTAVATLLNTALEKLLPEGMTAEECLEFSQARQAEKESRERFSVPPIVEALSPEAEQRRNEFWFPVFGKKIPGINYFPGRSPKDNGRGISRRAQIKYGNVRMRRS
ncbi:MAG: hypothetical protein NTV02_03250 [Candidatus Zambryskibacteria bacterium]|nr:hypothetical protein [Candidatus Zambryskibacteria bacterium]